MFLLPPPTPAPIQSIQLHVDARDAARGIFNVRERVRASGPLSLQVPKWIPGEHGPSGPVFDFVNIHFIQNYHELEWRHDPLDLFTIKVNSGPGPVEVRFQYVAPRHSIATRNIARIKWNRLILLPGGKAAAIVSPSLECPPGWSYATPLDFDHSGKLERVSAERLIDSPGVIGAHYRTYRLDSPGQPPAALEVFTEKVAEVPASIVEDHKRLYSQAQAFFGGAHFRHYQFLLTFSDQGAGDGLEHNECSEDGLGKDAIKNGVAIADLTAHEFSHSWCGKYRRPMGLAALDYGVPMNDEDLWIYEGFTQFAGVVLGKRSGAWTDEQFRDRLAEDLCYVDLEMAGRSWRPLEDTALFGSLINTQPDAWTSRRRSADYYTEMVLVYLEADGLIRRLSGGARSIDDVTRAFFGGPNRGPEIRPYTRREFYSTFNYVQPYDWERFFTTRVLKIRREMNDGWLEAAGWRFVQNSKENAFDKANQVGENKFADELTSIGLLVQDGEVRDVLEGSAADQAMLSPGMKLIAVNGIKYTVPSFWQAIEDSAKSSGLMEFVVDDYDVIRTIPVNYHRGLRRPHLERVADKPDLVTPVGEPRSR